MSIDSMYIIYPPTVTKGKNSIIYNILYTVDNYITSACACVFILESLASMPMFIMPTIRA
jgi:hypothetical protein